MAESIWKEKKINIFVPSDNLITTYSWHILCSRSGYILHRYSSLSGFFLYPMAGTSRSFHLWTSSFVFSRFTTTLSIICSSLHKFWKFMFFTKSFLFVISPQWIKWYHLTTWKFTFSFITRCTCAFTFWRVLVIHCSVWRCST